MSAFWDGMTNVVEILALHVSNLYIIHFFFSGRP